MPTLTSSLASTGSTTLCNGESTTVAVTITGGTSPYSVLLSNGQNINNYTSGTNITLSPYTTTTISVLNVTDAASCVSNSNTGSVLITVNPVTAITSQSTATQTQCEAGSFTPISVAATGIGLTYQWYSNASAVNSGGTSLGAANGAQTNTYTPQTAVTGTLYYYCMVTGTCGSVTSAVSGAFVVNPNLPVSVSIAASANPVCAGSSVIFTATPTNGGTSPTYQWQLNGVNIPSATSSTYTSSGLANGNSITCVLTKDNTQTCGTGSPATSNTVTMVVNPLPTITGTLSVCAGSATQLTGSGTAALTDPWVSASTGVATINSTGLVSGVSAGTSVITYTNNNGCSITATVTVNALPNPSEISTN